MPLIDSTILNKAPRTFDVVSTRSGHSVSLRDDGAAINADGTHPNGNRQHCLLQAAKRHKHGGKHPDAPSIASWVTAKKLDRSTGDSKVDPAMVFKTLDDVEIINGRPVSYGEIISRNMEADERRRADDVKLAIGEAKSRGADKDFLDRLENIVKGLAPAAPSKKEG